MTELNGRKTDVDHWDHAWEAKVRPRIPSRFNVDVLNHTRLLSQFVNPSCRYLEIGCAPGKLLAYVKKVFKANAFGLDYSRSGIENCRHLYNELGLDIELFHEDFFSNRLPKASFDVVTSFGFIEHFDNPELAVKMHFDLLKPGGISLISIPNYSGLYGLIQKKIDSKNLQLHNLKIMTPAALKSLVPSTLSAEVKTYYFGSFSPWLLSFDKLFPKPACKLFAWTLNFVGVMQPFKLDLIAPMLVLEIFKKA